MLQTHTAICNTDYCPTAQMFKRKHFSAMFVLYCLSGCAIKEGCSLRGRICILTCATDELHSSKIIIHVFVTKEGKLEVNSADERTDIRSHVVRLLERLFYFTKNGAHTAMQCKRNRQAESCMFRSPFLSFET